ncbi:MAG: DUF1028 domain-containing protein [Pseudomonadota bacterium]
MQYGFAWPIDWANWMQNLRSLPAVIVLLASLGISSVADATFSIVACDAKTGACGVAVATNNLAVGASVPFAQALLGAGVSQFETNPCHSETVLEAIASGKSAEASLAIALANESSCPDGLSNAFRQVAVVSLDGTSAAFTGEHAGGYAGHRSGRHWSVQGNGLAGEVVVDAMVDTFAGSKGPLAERLLRALEAGFESGGQTIGVLSAALVVRTPAGWPIDTDLRVDFAPGTAVTQLREGYDAQVARQLLFRAARTDSNDDALALVERAVSLAKRWDRILLRAARIANDGQSPGLKNAYACAFQRLNPVWAAMLEGEFAFEDCGEMSEKAR